MTVTHELGHVLVALAGGAKLRDLQLQPWHLPYSLFSGDPHPLATLWAGFVFGCAIPLVSAAAIGRKAVWYVAWFCLLANGIYLLIGYVVDDGELDSTKMIRAGARPVELLVVSTVMVLIGYIKFRQSCIGVISGVTPPMTRRALWISGGVLAAILAVQAVIATAIRAAL